MLVASLVASYRSGCDDGLLLWPPLLTGAVATTIVPFAQGFTRRTLVAGVVVGIFALFFASLAAFVGYVGCLS